MFLVFIARSAPVCLVEVKTCLFDVCYFGLLNSYYEFSESLIFVGLDFSVSAAIGINVVGSY